MTLRAADPRGTRADAGNHHYFDDTVHGTSRTSTSTTFLAVHRVGGRSSIRSSFEVAKTSEFDISASEAWGSVRATPSCAHSIRPALAGLPALLSNVPLSASPAPRLMPLVAALCEL